MPAGGSCLLGSINLSEFIINPFIDNAFFDYKSFEYTVEQSVIALNEVLHEGLELHPLKEQRESVNDWRQIGCGCFGWHDCLIKMGIKYGSQQSLDLANSVGACLINTALVASAELTKKYGTYPKYNSEAILKSKFLNSVATDETIEIISKLGLANSQLLTIPPTGTIATMLGVSTALEPIYNFSYTRKTESLHNKDKYYKVYTPIVEEYMDVNGIEDEKDLPDFFNTAMTINYKDRINMQSAWQYYIDASISSTVNVPEKFTIKETENLYLYAWEKGLKGVTLFRDNCKRVGVLTNGTKDKETKVEHQELEWGTTIQLSDDLIGKKKKVMSGCGSVHVQAWFNPDDGRLMEIFLSKGSSGGCNSWMISNSRMISLALRTGADFEYVIDQLKSTPTCPSYAVRNAVHKDCSKGNCCPTAVGNALVEMQKEIYDELFDNDEQELQTINKDEIVKKQTAQKTQVKIKCPECGEDIKFEGGCQSCPHCSWSKCD